jgi:hypothetical protein
MQGDIQLQNGRLISQRVQLTFDQPSVDIELASYIAQTVLGYSFVKVSAMGIYVNNPAAPTVFARVHKSWVQGIWNNGTTYQIDGAALEQGAFNSDSTNFPAGAVNAGSALIVATTGSVKLRFLNRVSPSTGSTTTWVYTIEIMNT